MSTSTHGHVGCILCALVEDCRAELRQLAGPCSCSGDPHRALDRLASLACTMDVAGTHDGGPWPGAKRSRRRAA
jgi:hypothetical protein